MMPISDEIFKKNVGASNELCLSPSPAYVTSSIQYALQLPSSETSRALISQQSYLLS